MIAEDNVVAGRPAIDGVASTSAKDDIRFVTSVDRVAAAVRTLDAFDSLDACRCGCNRPFVAKHNVGTVARTNLVGERATNDHVGPCI